MTDRTARVIIKGETSGYTSAMDRAAKSTDHFAEKAQQAQRQADKWKLVGAAAAAMGAAVAVGLKQAIDAASDLAESQSKVGVVFGSSAQKIVNWSKTAATSMGMSQQTALEAAGTFGNLFVAMNMGQRPAAAMSTRLVQLAADLASFNNVSPEEALDALRSGLVGETEPLRRFGVNLDDASLRQRALAMGLMTTTSSVLPPAIKAQAAYALIMDQTSTAQGDYARTADGAANSQRTLAAQMKDAEANLGSAVLPAWQELLKTGNSVLGLFNSLPSPLRTAAVLLLAVGVASAILGSRLAPVLATMSAAGARITAGLATVPMAVRSIGTAWQYAGMQARSASGPMATTGQRLGVMTKSFGGATGAASALRGAGAGLLGMLGGPWGIAFAAATVGVLSFANAQEDAKARAESLEQTLDAISGKPTAATFAAIAKSIRQSADADGVATLERLGLNMADVSRWATQGQAGLDQFAAKTGAMYDEIGRLGDDTALNALNDVRGAFWDQNKGATAAAKGWQDGAAAADDAANAAGKLPGPLTDTKSAAQKAADAVKALDDALAALAGTQTGADAAESAYQAALDAVGKAVKENGQTLDLHSAKGRANMAVLADIADTALKTIEPMRRNGATVGEVTKHTEDARTAFKAAARAMGLTSAEARTLASSYGLVPRKVKTAVTAPGLNQVYGDLDAYLARLGRIPKWKRTLITTVYQTDEERRGRAQDAGTARAAGGRISGPGSGTSDSIPVMLSNGEWVVKERAVKTLESRFGPGVMHAINSGRLPAGYASGGKVSPIEAYRREARQTAQAESIEHRLGGLSSAARAELQGMGLDDRLSIDRALRSGGHRAVAAFNRSVRQHSATERAQTRASDAKSARDARAEQAAGIAASMAAGSTIMSFDFSAQTDAIREQVDAKKALADAEAQVMDARRAANMAGTPQEQADAAKKLAEANDALATSKTRVADADSAVAKTKPTVANIKGNFAAKLRALARFGMNLKTLARKGLHPSILKEIIDAGPIEGAAMAEALVSGSAKDIADLNRLEAGILRTAATIGNLGAEVDYSSQAAVAHAASAVASAGRSGSSATAGAMAVQVTMSGSQPIVMKVSDKQIAEAMVHLQRRQGGYVWATS